MKKKRMVFSVVLLLCIILIACGQTKEKEDLIEETTTETEEEQLTMKFERITMEEAKRLMVEEEEYVILDVRRKEEYAQGHIPGAVCIPNESIGEEMLEELPEKDQLLLVYCRSGNRSKQAAAKLAEIGYSNIKEFGGILDWDGDIEF